MVSLFDGTFGENDIGEIYRRMETNCPNPWSNSQSLWKLRRATDLAVHNKSRETMLEKAVAMLADNGNMPGWFNQCPTASGIGDSSRSKHSNVDLVHWRETDGHARLIELKWGSDSPSEAVQQILRYGASYAFCRMHRNKLPIRRGELMDARHVSLQVAAPALYCAEPSLPGCLSRARDGLKKFDIGSRIEGLSMSLDVLAFPEGFDHLPFSNGAEVSAGCDRKELTETGRKIRDVFDNLIAVFPDPNGQQA